MSTRKSTHSWDQYVKEAEAEDFVLTTADGEIRVTNPTGIRVMLVAQGMRTGDLDAILLGLTGEAYEAIKGLLATSGHKALPKLVEDLMDHFDMYDEIELVGPGGGTVKATRPREIRGLLSSGYTPKEK